MPGVPNHWAVASFILKRFISASTYFQCLKQSGFFFFFFSCIIKLVTVFFLYAFCRSLVLKGLGTAALSLNNNNDKKNP